MIYILPIILIFVFLYSLIKNIPAYDNFVNGVKSAFNLVLSIFPYLVAIFIFIELMNISGLSSWLAKTLSPVLSFLQIPSELSELIILRPFSGSGSLALLENIYAQYGVDSYVGLCASVIVGASDTVFYVISIYFSTIKIRKMRYLLPVCLISCLVGSIMACLFVKWFLF